MKAKIWQYIGVSLLFISTTILLIACSTPKPAIATVDNGSAHSTSERIVGTVMITKECGCSIEVTDGDVIRNLYPLNLEKKYRVNGMRLKFAVAYNEDALPPESCMHLIPVDVSEVTALR